MACGTCETRNDGARDSEAHANFVEARKRTGEKTTVSMELERTWAGCNAQNAARPQTTAGRNKPPPPTTQTHTSTARKPTLRAISQTSVRHQWNENQQLQLQGTKMAW